LTHTHLSKSSPLYTTIHTTILHCNTLQHIATHCNTLQHIATQCTHCNRMQQSEPMFRQQIGVLRPTHKKMLLTYTATNCATHYNTLQHSTTHCSTCVSTTNWYSVTNIGLIKQNKTPTHIQRKTFKFYTGTNCVTYCATHCQTLQHTATHCNALRRTAKHCHTLQQFGVPRPTHNQVKTPHCTRV